MLSGNKESVNNQKTSESDLGTAQVRTQLHSSQIPSATGTKSRELSMTPKDWEKKKMIVPQIGKIGQGVGQSIMSGFRKQVKFFQNPLSENLIQLQNLNRLPSPNSRQPLVIYHDSPEVQPSSNHNLIS